MADALLARLQKRGEGSELSSVPPTLAPPRPIAPQYIAEPVVVTVADLPAAVTAETVMTHHVVPRQRMPDLRPASIHRSQEYFGRSALDQCIDWLTRCRTNATALGIMADRANNFRLVLVIVGILAASASSAVSGAPVCSRQIAPTTDDWNCQGTYNSIASALAGLSVIAMGVLEKSNLRKDAIRLRDLAQDYEDLAALLHRRIYTSPPENTTPADFVRQVSRTFEALESRRKGPRPTPEAIAAAGETVLRQQQSDPALRTIV